MQAPTGLSWQMRKNQLPLGYDLRKGRIALPGCDANAFKTQWDPNSIHLDAQVVEELSK
jgi:acyl dehydratase